VALVLDVLGGGRRFEGGRGRFGSGDERSGGWIGTTKVSGGLVNSL